ncbi:hypothetical protein Q5794_05605 [Priestia megaterium]
MNGSDFFIDMVSVGFMYIVYLWIGGQDEDSCGTSGKQSLAWKSTAF